MAEYGPSINDAANKNWGEWVNFTLSFDQPKKGQKDDGTTWELWGATYSGAEPLDCGDKGALSPGAKCSFFLEFDLQNQWYQAAPHRKGEQASVRIRKAAQDKPKQWQLMFADKAQQERSVATVPAPVGGTPSQFLASEAPAAPEQPTFKPAPKPVARPTIDDLGRTMLGCLAAARWAFEYAHLEPAVEDIRAAGVAIFIAAVNERTSLPAATDLPETEADIPERVPVDPTSAPAQGATVPFPVQQGDPPDDDLPF